jgi:GTP-binding protein Era
MSEEKATRCGFIAVIGAPNAGKSTLVNRMVGSKVAIVTHKAQTTRMPLRGVALAGQAQLIFVDTPGLFEPKKRLDRAMVEAAWQRTGEADVVLLMVDAPRLAYRTDSLLVDDPAMSPIIAGLKRLKRPVILVLNKIDAMDRRRLLALARWFQEGFTFDATFMISALTGDGVDDLKEELARRMPEGPWLYPADQAADVPLRLLASEITREKLMLRLHDELPYASTVETEVWRALKDGSVRIEQVIHVARDSQRPIVLGKGGRTIKAIGEEARREIEALVGHRVHLFLTVKVSERWADEPERYERMGLVFPKG